jgi:simple sugar transport system permease protein
MKMLLDGCMDIKNNATYSLTQFYPNAVLPKLGVDQIFHGTNSYVTMAVPMAILVAILIWYLLTKTKKGYELRATGLNKDAAKYAGMKGRTNTITTMAISGALAGLGAALYYLTGMQPWEKGTAAVLPMGFNGIAAAFLGGLHPIGAIFSSFFIQHITDGGQYVNTNFYSSQISDLISSVIIYLCGFVLFIKITMNNMIAKSEDRRTQKQKTVEAAGKEAD